MKKILNIITLSETGGAQKIVYSIANGLKENFEMSVACSPGGELVQWLKDKGIRVYEIKELGRNINFLKDAALLLRLFRLIKEEHFDIVHCHSWKAGVTGRLAAFTAGCKNIIFTVHGWSILNSTSKFVSFFFVLIERLLGKITTSIVCVCENDRAQGIKLKIAVPEKFTVIYNGIEEVYEIFKEQKPFSLPEGSIVIGTVARMARQKMVMETVQLMKALFEKYQRMYFVWIGDGPLFPDTQKYIEHSGLGGRFLLSGRQNDVYRYLNSLDIYMLLSRYEGLSISILEAMNAGLPVIASNVGGVCEQVLDNITGFLVGSDPQQIVDRTVELIEDKNKREAFGREGYNIFHSKFTIDKMVESYKRLYEKQQ